MEPKFSSEPNPYDPPGANELHERSHEDHTEFLLSGCLTAEDVLAANRIATRGLWPKFVLAMFVVVTFTIVLIAIAVSSRPHSPNASNVMLLVACVIFPAILLVPFFIGRWRLHRFARKKLGMFAPTRSVISNSRILITSEHAKSELDWKLFSHCIANDIVAVIYFKDADRYMTLARHKLQDPSQWDALVSMIQSRLNG